MEKNLHCTNDATIGHYLRQHWKKNIMSSRTFLRGGCWVAEHRVTTTHFSLLLSLTNFPLIATRLAAYGARRIP